MKPSWIGILVLIVFAAGAFLSKLSTSIAPLTREQLKISTPQPIRLRPKAPPKVRSRQLSTAKNETPRRSDAGLPVPFFQRT